MHSLVAILLMLFVAIPCSVASPAPSKTDKSKPQATRSTYPLYGKVVSINAETLVIKGGQGKPDRSFVLNKATLITKNAKPVAISQVVPGQWVGGLVRKVAGGPPLVEKLNLSVKQKP